MTDVLFLYCCLKRDKISAKHVRLSDFTFDSSAEFRFLLETATEETHYLSRFREVLRIFCLRMEYKNALEKKINTQ